MSAAGIDYGGRIENEELFNELGLRRMVCVESEFNVSQDDEIAQAVLSASDDSPNVLAPNTGFATQNGANFLPVAIVSVIAIAVTIAVAVIMKRKK